MKPIEEFFPLLHSNKTARIVITTHQKPDGDAMGSSLGLKWFLTGLGFDVQVISPTNWPNFLNWMPGCKEVIDFESRMDYGVKQIELADWIFCLDFNVLNRTRKMESYLAAAKATRILIDHHQEPQTEMFEYGVSDTSKSSTAEMVYDLIMAVGGKQALHVDIAACLYAGAMTDTGSFRYPSTSASVHRMVADLKDTGLQHEPIHEHLFDNYLENRFRFMGQLLLNRMEVIYELNTVLLVVPKSDIIQYDITIGDTAGMVNIPFSIQGIKMVAIVIDRDAERKWSFRSKGDVDVNAFARQYFEGGGHKNAAGGRSSDSLEETVKHFYQTIETLKESLA